MSAALERVPPPSESLDAAEARALTDEVKHDAQELWRKLLRLYEGAAHAALGYSSWHAYCEAEFGFGQSHSYRLLDAGRVAQLVPQLGNEAQARELVPLLDDEAALVDVVRELRAEHGERLTAEKIRAAVMEKLAFDSSVHGLKSSRSQEWYTPPVYVEAVRQVLGSIDLDPTACALSNEVVRPARFYDIDSDGLAHEWHGRVFLNPPYNRAGEFVAKLLREHRAGRVTAAIVLLNAHGFDADWFEPLWDHTLCFTNHRIEFWSPAGPSGGPMNGNVFVYVGPDRARFGRVFSQFGAVGVFGELALAALEVA